MLALLASHPPLAQGPAPSSPLRLLAASGRRAVPTTVIDGQEFLAADELATLLQVTVREDAQAGGLTLSYRGRTAVLSLDRPLASVGGRVVSLPAAAVRAGGRWLVPLDVLTRAIAPIHDQRIDVRRASRLLIIGDLRVPRVLVRLEAVGGGTRATVDVIPSATVSTLAETGLVQLRVDADALDVATPTGGALPFGLVENVRAAEVGATVAIDLTPAAGTARVSMSAADNVTRVTVDVPPQGAVPVEAPPAPAVSSAAEPAAPLARPPDRTTLRTIVVDPGHGGDDAGARGASGTLEKTLTLSLARRLRTALESRLGIRVLLTRDDDRAVTLDERAAFANNSKADLFISLHANAAPTPQPRGVSLLYASLAGSIDGESAPPVAAATLPVLGGGARAIELVRWEFAQAPFVVESATLAAAVEEALRGQLPMAVHTARQAPLRVLGSVHMPAVLVETAFLTTPADEVQAASEAFQTRLTRGLTDGVIKFRQVVEPPR